MSTLTEIEAAAELLTVEQKRELFLFLAQRLRSVSGPLPPAREFSREQIAGWIADDQEGLRSLEMIDKGMEDVRAGRTRPMREAIRQIANELGVKLPR